MKFNPLIPEFMVSDLAKSLAFYEQGLGFVREYDRLAKGFAFLSLEGSQIMLDLLQPGHPWILGPMDPPLGRGINFQIEVKAVDALHARVAAAGYKPWGPPEDHWRQVREELYGDREFLIQDPDGYLLRFSQAIGVK